MKELKSTCLEELDRHPLDLAVLVGPHRPSSRNLVERHVPGLAPLKGPYQGRANHSNREPRGTLEIPSSPGHEHLETQDRRSRSEHWPRGPEEKRSLHYGFGVQAGV